ncbi:hypothetical protein ACH436_00430 [Isoptericola sp. NPDC019693]|uniref:hypothetical protein n=1 Tax=Isoptericola sp. NPDC019693 TaxID=3364009 RepID=UPI0037B0AD6F
MSAVVVLVGMVWVVLPAFLVWFVLLLTSRRTTDDGGDPARAARRHEALMSWGAFAAAAVCAVALAAQPVVWPGWAPAPGLLQAMAPFSIALVFCAVRAIGERTWPRPAGEVRAAPLGRRTARSVGGARLVVVLVTATLLAVTLVVCGITADASGRAYATGPVTLPDGGVTTGSSGPYPGWPYGAPMLLGIVATVLATLLALRAVVRRPPLHGVPAPHDDAVRATSAARLLGAVQVCLGVALAGTLFIAGSAVRSRGESLVYDGGPVQLGATLGSVGQAAIVAGLVIAVTSVIAGLLAARRRPARPRTIVATTAAA